MHRIGGIALQGSALRPGSVHCRTAQRAMHVMQDSAVNGNTVQCNAVKYRTFQVRSVWANYSTVQIQYVISAFLGRTRKSAMQGAADEEKVYKTNDNPKGTLPRE